MAALDFKQALADSWQAKTLSGLREAADIVDEILALEAEGTGAHVDADVVLGVAREYIAAIQDMAKSSDGTARAARALYFKLDALLVAATRVDPDFPRALIRLINQVREICNIMDTEALEEADHA